MGSHKPIIIVLVALDGKRKALIGTGTGGNARQDAQRVAERGGTFPLHAAEALFPEARGATDNELSKLHELVMGNNGTQD
jgi:hypothetical protein